MVSNETSENPGPNPVPRSGLVEGGCGGASPELHSAAPREMPRQRVSPKAHLSGGIVVTGKADV